MLNWLGVDDERRERNQFQQVSRVYGFLAFYRRVARTEFGAHANERGPCKNGRSGRFGGRRVSAATMNYKTKTLKDKTESGCRRNSLTSLK